MKTERPSKKTPKAIEPVTAPMSGETPVPEQPSAPQPPAPTGPQVGTPRLQLSAVMHISDPVPTDAATPAMSELERKRAEAAQDAPQDARGPHPYEYQIMDRIAVPAAFRDAEYNIDRALIDAHLQDAWEHQRNPIIAGVMIGEHLKA